jgi:superfamily II DNA/RNA helicase
MKKKFRTTPNGFGKKNNSQGNFSRNRKSGGFRKPFNKQGAKENIDISLFIKKPTTERTPEIIIKNTFDDFKISEELRQNLNRRNYKKPTPIQDQAINHALDGRDLIGLANTGTGKTAAFLLPLIDKVFKNNQQKVLIIAPTRELALQIENELHQFSYGMKIYFASCVGGMPIGKQIQNLKRDPSFVIGTPGRLKDLIDRGLIRLNTFNNIVLDEVDRMLDMGFVKEIRDILEKLPKDKQSLFFSATLPPKIKSLVSTFLRNPVTVEVYSGKTAENIEQDIVRVASQDIKFDILTDLLAKPDLSKVLIFSETKRDVKKLEANLVKRGFKAESIHGNKNQGQRQRALKAFKDNQATILVATDVAARGIDVKDISHVINYTTPRTYDDYVHRIGRTGRGDKSGKALTFVGH